MRKNSIGNDIVALQHTNAERAGEPKFYSKFLSPSELSLFYHNELSLSFVQFAWLCWSIKESVFKFQKRIAPQAISGGWKIKIAEIDKTGNQFISKEDKYFIEDEFLRIDNCYHSVAIINSVQYHSWSFVTDSFIHTITSGEASVENIYWGIKFIGDENAHHQSAEVRSFLLQKLDMFLPAGNLTIEKNDLGIPYIHQYPQIPVSFTHDENWVAFAFLLEENDRQLAVTKSVTNSFES